MQQEESASDGAKTSILIVIVVALCVTIVAMTIVCLLKRKRKTDPLTLAVAKESARLDTDGQSPSESDAK